MSVCEPLTEVHKELLPIVHDFLSRADTQGLHTIVEKHIRDTEKLQGTFEMLKNIVERLQRETEELRVSNNKYSLENEKLRASSEKQSSEVEKLQGTVERLQTSVEKFSGANEELRTSNEKLQSFSKDATEKINAIEVKLDIDLEHIVNNLENKTRTANQDLGNRIGQLHNNTRAALKDLQGQMHDLDARQQHNEQSLGHVANAVHDLQISAGMQEPRKELYPDPYMQSSHGSWKRRHEYERDEELADPQYGGGSKRLVRDKLYVDDASRQTTSAKQPPRLTRQDAAKVEKSTAQRLTTREAVTGCKNQTEATVSNDSDDVNPRFEAIKAHYNASKATFNATQPKDQRSFIWKFIEGSGDDEFCIWFQEHLLEVLPSDKVTRSAKKSRNTGGRIIALNRNLTWEEVRRVVRDIPNSLPPFLE